MEFKKCLKKLRIENNLTQDELGKKIGISGKVISKWESGYSMPDIEKIKVLCLIFNCDYEDLIGPGKKKNKEEKNTKEKKIDQKANLNDSDYKVYRTVSKIMYILTKICRIALYICIPFIILGMIFIPSIISRISIDENVISYKNFKGDVYSISLDDVRLNGEYTVKNGDDVVRNTINFDILKKISNAINKTSNSNIIAKIEIAFVLIFISLVISIIIFYNLEAFFKNLYEKETPFTKENISFLGTCASLMIASLVCNYIISLFIEGLTTYNIGNDLSLVNVIEVLFIFVLIYIFKYGYNLQKITNGTIYNQE